MDGTQYSRGFVPSYLVRRMTDPAVSEWKALFADEPRWAWGAVQIFRALGSPFSQVKVPANPFSKGIAQTDPLKGNFFRETTYWSALHALTTLRLGWVNAANGVGNVTLPEFSPDPMLKMIATVWRQDGHLSEYVKWSGANFFSSHKEQPRETSVLDEKHIEGHVTLYWGEMGSSFSARLTCVNSTARTAVLVCETAHGWYGELSRLGSELPNIGNHSWSVDVYVKPIGFMGTYRQSRVTGRWFVGRHAIHMLGNVDPDLYRRF